MLAWLDGSLCLNELGQSIANPRLTHNRPVGEDDIDIPLKWHQLTKMYAMQFNECINCDPKVPTYLYSILGHGDDILSLNSRFVFKYTNSSYYYTCRSITALYRSLEGDENIPVPLFILLF